MQCPQLLPFPCHPCSDARKEWAKRIRQGLCAHFYVVRSACAENGQQPCRTCVLGSPPTLYCLPVSRIANGHSECACPSCLPSAWLCTQLLGSVDCIGHPLPPAHNAEPCPHWLGQAPGLCLCLWEPGSGGQQAQPRPSAQSIGTVPGKLCFCPQACGSPLVLPASPTCLRKSYRENTHRLGGRKRRRRGGRGSLSLLFGYSQNTYLL